MIIGGVIRFLLPLHPVLVAIDACNQGLFRLWVINNVFLLWLTNKTEWDIEGNDMEPIKGSCIIISNHLSWTDIVILNHVYRGKIPITKFFLKQSLIYIPIVGLACYSIGMPFMHRYTRAQILKNPALKNKDMDTTRKACERLLTYPSTLVNFCEGTRFTEAKASAQKSPYQHLMPPKAMSLAVALGLIGAKIDAICNTTLLYPDNDPNKSIFLALLSGRLKRVVARVEVIKQPTITETMVGDYLNDKHFKREFTNLIREKWQEKDELITKLLTEHPGTFVFNKPAPAGADAPTAAAADPAVAPADTTASAPGDTAVSTAADTAASVPADTTASSDTAASAPADTAAATPDNEVVPVTVSAGSTDEVVKQDKVH